MIQASVLNLVKYIFGELIGDFVYAPVWWYSKGFLGLLSRSKQKLISFEKSIGLLFWLTTIFKPMYGQYDIASRIISVLMRVLVLIWRFAILFVYFVFLVLVVLFWLFAPIFVVWQIWYQLINLLK